MEPSSMRRPSLPPGMPPVIELPPRRPSFLMDTRETNAKRARFEGDDHRTPLRDSLDLSVDLARAPLHLPYPSHRGSADFSSQHQRDEWERGGGGVGPAALQDTSRLCSRCRRLTTQSDDPRHDLEPVHGNGSKGIQNPELVLVTQAAAAELTKAITFLSSGISSAKRGAIRHESVEPRELEQPIFPPIAHLGLKETLDWIVGRILRVNELADKLVQHVQSTKPLQQEPNSPWYGDDQDGHNMKRHLDPNQSDEGRPNVESGEPLSDSKPFTRRKSVMTIPNSEDLPSIRSHHEYQQFQSSMDDPNRRSSIMNPPPAPIRQLPTSPGRSLPSPTSVNFPSPSAASFGSSSQSMNLSMPGLHASAGGTYLPSIASSQSSDSALQAHSAALQHEVSVQKIALSSLQGEHDKLLAAFSRSQTRASALEKKHTVSDNEIITLSEEKIKLQNQVTDLEKDVEDLTRSRDEARQSAVQDAAQYVEIVKRASQLEEMAAEDRRSWQILKAEMEQKILALTSGDTSGRHITMNDSMEDHMLGGESEPATSSRLRNDNDGSDTIKIEPSSPIAPRSFGVTTIIPESSPNVVVSTEQSENLTTELRKEIHRLQTRCAEVEDTLRAVREESRTVEGIVKALGATGKSILDKADKALGDNNVVSDASTIE